MAAPVTLSAPVRNALLSLRRTSSLITQAQSRVSSGLRVAGAVDDAVKFFQAKTLSSRAAFFSRLKDNVDQGVSSANAALTAAEGVESLVEQLKGLAQSLSSATGGAFTDLVRQFNDLRSQINTLTADATYQGVNLVNGTGDVLEVEFSEGSNSLLRVNSVDLTSTGLGVYEVEQAVTGDSIIEAEAATGALEIFNRGRTRNTTAISQLTVFYNFTYKGKDDVIGTGSYEVRYGTQTLTLRVDTGTVTITQGRVFNVAITTNEALTAGIRVGNRRQRAAAVGRIVPGAGLVAADPTIAYFDNLAVVRADLSTDTGNVLGVRLQIEENGAELAELDYVLEGDTASINEVLDRLDVALDQAQSDARILSSNVALLQTRLDFTEKYVNTLEEGAEKLTLADLDAESARLLALQTRQKLGASVLSAARQAESAIVSLISQAVSGYSLGEA